MKKEVHASWLIAALSCITLCCILSLPAFAAEAKKKVSGKVYEFDKDSHYEISEASSNDAATTKASNTYGSFFITGDISKTSTKDDVPAYEVELSNETLDLFYTYSDDLLTAEDGALQLIDDKSKEVNGKSLEDKIMKGAILLQTSKDRKSWTNIECWTNIFADEPTKTDALYSATDIQLNNGCFYRVIVAYETKIKTDPNKVLFVELDQYEYVKHAEVYEFYAYTSAAEEDTVDPNQTYRLGSTVRAEQFDGYYGKVSMKVSDVHYGWDIGDFYVSGYTDTVIDDNRNVIFLKNVGDEVTLWFKLKKNIDDIKGDGKVSVTTDDEGYDQYFQTPKINLGRGALIIRYTDYKNEKSEPTIYTNYLESNACVGADTRVKMFEEGDYEVALDYQISKNQIIDTVGHYRIFFKFSVRNGNCMVYPFDIKTGGELSNASITENGFRLDLAKSRYLTTNIEREILKEGASGLTKDTRFNGAAKDGAEYTDEGIYTITVKNDYTDQSTVKTIYVGTNSILKAYVANMGADGEEGYSIAEINARVEGGATILDDGTIQVVAKQNKAATVQSSQNSTSVPATISMANAGATSDVSSSFNGMYFVGAGAVLCLLIIAFTVAKKRKQKNASFNNEDNDANGGAEQ